MLAESSWTAPFEASRWRGGHRPRGSSDEHRMVKALAGKSQGSPDVFEVEVRQLFYHLLGGEPVGEQIQDITDANPQAPNAGTPPALFGVYRNPVGKIGHAIHLSPWIVTPPHRHANTGCS